MVLSNVVKPKSTTILVDLGGIFTHPPFEKKLEAHGSTLYLRRIMSTSDWMSYECGQLSEQECFAKLADEYHF
jgi:hypothetical protein